MGDPGYLKWKGLRDVVSEASFQVQDAITSTILAEFSGCGFSPKKVRTMRPFLSMLPSFGLSIRSAGARAAPLILQRAGGILTDAEGMTCLYPNGGYIASNGVIHGWTLNCIQAVGKNLGGLGR